MCNTAFICFPLCWINWWGKIVQNRFSTNHNFKFSYIQQRLNCLFTDMHTTWFLYLNTSEILRIDDKKKHSAIISRLFWIVRFTFTLKLQAPSRTDFSSSCHCTGLPSAVVPLVFVVFAFGVSVVVDWWLFVFVELLLDFFRLRKLNVRLKRSIWRCFFRGTDSEPIELAKVLLGSSSFK